jgi:hypothetical protein
MGMKEQDCRSCKDWRKCPGREGYLFAHLRWCPYQVIWCLQNAEILHSGRWPEAYGVGEPRKKQVSYEGYFVKPAVIIAELDKRLRKCRNAGDHLIVQIRDNTTQDKNCRPEDLDDEAWEVLMYVKGWRRKTMPFYAWKKKHRWRKNVHQKVDEGNQNGLSKS